MTSGFFGHDPSLHWNLINQARAASSHQQAVMGFGASSSNRMLPVGVQNFVGAGNVSPAQQHGVGVATARKRTRSKAGVSNTPGDAVAVGGVLPPPSHGALVNGNLDILPEPAEASNAPELIGEEGGQGPADPRRTAALAMARLHTSPEAVAPQSMGLQNPHYNPAAHAISTQHAPDQGVESMQLAMAKQLPETDAYRNLTVRGADAGRAQAASALGAQSAMQAAAAGATPGEGNPMGGGRRSIFRARGSGPSTKQGAPAAATFAVTGGANT